MDHEAALRAVQNQKPPPKPWRGNSAMTSGGAPPPPPPKVYRVEPREFRDLVQRLTGAPAPPPSTMPVMMQPQQPVPVRAATVGTAEDHHHYPSPSWFSFPMDHGNGPALM